MKAILTIARKELRALFHSPVALLFLGVFELVTLFAFFSASRFFARNLADVRPLFEWLPLLLVFLVAAVTMRQWAEERKLGTLEVLLTLPVKTSDLVLGKFLAATGLVAVALALTLPLPLMVASLGPLDWGPVIGGYLGALLLGALYVSLGLCVSSRTDNQVVALMLTLVLGGLLWLVGTDGVTALFGTASAELLRALGTGSRFESIARGVIDLRDLAYYAAGTGFFLALNVVFLESGRIDAESGPGKARAKHLATLTALAAVNAVLLVFWLAPVTAARVDMTANGDFSISPTTSRLMQELDEPLYIDGFFSERTHPLLAPLVPQIRDLLAEYEVAGRGRVTVQIRDPNQDEALEQEIAEQYAIRSVPFQVDDRHQQAVVNSFFHLLVRYGDKYDVLSFDELIEFSVQNNQPQVRLRNLEYDLTRTIKKVSQDFTPIGAVLSRLPAEATLTGYLTPATLPAELADALPALRKVAGDLAAASGGKLRFNEVDPGGDRATQQDLFQRYGLRPVATDLFGTEVYYAELVLEMGERVERLSMRGGGLTEADLRTALESAVKRMVPGQLTTVGVFTENPEAPPQDPNIPPQFQPPPPRPDFQMLKQVLGESYEVAEVDLSEDPRVPDTVDVLLVAKPGALSADAKQALDQYLMRGGKVIAMASSRKINIDRGGLSATNAPEDLADLLRTYGVVVGGDLVADTRNASFPRPVQQQRGGMTFQRIELTPYPFFVDVRDAGFSRGHPILSGLTSFTLPWASPLTVQAPEGVEATVVARSSADAWTYGGLSLDPPTPGNAEGELPLLVSLSGTFPSAVASDDEDATDGLMPRSLPDARLVVVGSADLTSDLLMQLASQPGGEAHRPNFQLLENLIDFAVEDTDLLSIRTAGAFARTLRPMTEDERTLYETSQYVFALVLLAVVAIVPRRRRRHTLSIPLPTSEAK